MESALGSRRPRQHGDEHDHHGPPEANQSSRVEAQFLGMLLFIISEIMLFGAFFTAYFFIRVVADSDVAGSDGTELPVAVAGVNTAILISSSFTMHWALEGARNENRAALRVGMLTTLLLGAHLPHASRSTSTCTSASRPPTTPRARSSTGSPGCTAPTSSWASPCSTFATIRAFRGHFTAKEHRGVEIPGIYWHFVDVMWIVVYTSIYIL